MSMEGSYEFAELKADEIDEVRDLWGILLQHHQDVATHLAPLGRRLSVEESWVIRRAQYLEWLATGTAKLWIVRPRISSTEPPVAYCFVRMGEPSGSWDWGLQSGVLETLVVDPSARGAGLGTQLFRMAESHFRDLGVHVLKVSLIAGNEGAIRLYRRLGFIDQLHTLVMPIRPEKSQ